MYLWTLWNSQWIDWGCSDCLRYMRTDDFMMEEVGVPLTDADCEPIVQNECSLTNNPRWYPAFSNLQSQSHDISPIACTHISTSIFKSEFLTWWAHISINSIATLSLVSCVCNFSIGDDRLCTHVCTYDSTFSYFFSDHSSNYIVDQQEYHVVICVMHMYTKKCDYSALYLSEVEHICV